MSEIPIAIEGKETKDGRYIEPGALVLPIGVVPVTRNSAEETFGIVGRALGFRRDEDGVIHATIDLLDDDLADDETATIDVHDVGFVDSDPLKITAGRIRALHLRRGPGNAWPELDR
jgi:hypothetical protein